MAGVGEAKVWDLVFGGDLEVRYESGQIGDREFYDDFCRGTDTQPDYDALLLRRQRHLRAELFDLSGRGRARLGRLSLGHSVEHLP